MKILGITKPDNSSYSSLYAKGFIVEVTPYELSKMTGQEAHHIREDIIGKTLDINEIFDDFVTIRRDFKNLPESAKHFRSMADHIDKLKVPQFKEEKQK